MRTAVRIALHRIAAWRGEYRVWAAFGVCLAFCIMYASRYIPFSEVINSPIQAAEVYVLLGSLGHGFTGVLLGAILMLSDAPFISPRSTYEVLRVGKRRWLWGQILYIFMSVGLYTLCAALFCTAAAALSGRAYFADTWSGAMTMLANSSQPFAITEFKLSFQYSGLVNSLSPWGAVLMTILSNGLYTCLLCMCMFAVNVLSGKNLGWLAAGLIHIAGYVVIANGIMFPQNLSLLACALPGNQFEAGSGITVGYSLGVFTVFILLFVFLPIKRSEEVEL